MTSSKRCLLCGEKLSPWEKNVCEACTERELDEAEKEKKKCTICRRKLNKKELKEGRKKCKRCIS